MSSSEYSWGVVLTPPFYLEFRDLYVNQRDHLLRHPGNTAARESLSAELGQALQFEVTKSARKYAMAYYGISKQVLDTEVSGFPDGMAIDPPQVQHFVESLYRQSGQLRLSARELDGDTAQWHSAHNMANRKAGLALELQDANFTSFYAPRVLPSELAFGYWPLGIEINIENAQAIA